MLEVKKSYEDIRFSSSIFSALFVQFQDLMRRWEDEGLEKAARGERRLSFREEAELDTHLSVTRDGEYWDYDSIDEYVAAYKAGFSQYIFGLYWRSSLPDFSLRAPRLVMQTSIGPASTIVNIEVAERVHGLRLLQTLDNDARLPGSQVPKKRAKSKIFLGHGGAPDWRELQADLRDKHDIDIIAFESGAREGHAVRDVISEMLQSADFALLVMTAEDEQSDHTFRARQNVIHEAGLFQGRLGYHRAILMVEEGVEHFSNVAGIVYMSFERGRILARTGDILAVLRREGLYP
ncbi:Predicted nucleotide-binding protein containing TIR-like domain-containing protein [Jatrophihabitans endophyticus]|uniref:Predicted nucleotide-binding protein containing TIR-like domain-containing protein n=1 Tax=Jatrophihabitans endophyticus TaxID=1206085 RepID=A0A1M5GEF6_9ACTN|nr:nucleotide-binding protein [Jatrophihabitans endophyticus]SHG02079.1 Predicted nucleotide-binding protein containing TIR-like domain-containing protein [Jatrophihabitans endophyticus]